MYPIAPPAKSGSREAAVAFIMMGYLTRRKGRRKVYKINVVGVDEWVSEPAYMGPRTSPVSAYATAFTMTLGTYQMT
jgi:hypothetical protein